MVASVLYTLILLFLVGGAIVRIAGREKWQRTTLFLLAWVGIFGLIFVLYSFRFELKSVASRVMAELDPRSAVVLQPHKVLIKGNRQGHYIVDVRVGGTEVPMLVDTGATNVVLTPDHAQMIGLQLDTLNYNVSLRTAGGTVYAARVNLDEMSLGEIVVRDVEAYVSRVKMGESLLGMSFLSRLERISVTEQGLEMVSVE